MNSTTWLIYVLPVSPRGPVSKKKKKTGFQIARFHIFTKILLSKVIISDRHFSPSFWHFNPLDGAFTYPKKVAREILVNVARRKQLF